MIAWAVLAVWTLWLWAVLSLHLPWWGRALIAVAPPLIFVFGVLVRRGRGHTAINLAVEARSQRNSRHEVRGVGVGGYAAGATVDLRKAIGEHIQGDLKVAGNVEGELTLIPLGTAASPWPVPKASPWPVPKKAGLAGLSREIARYVDREIKRLEWGEIALNAPAEMRVGGRETITARICRSVDPNLVKALEGSAQPQIQQIKVGEKMSATLEGPAFDKELVSPGRPDQRIADGECGDWQWSVKPLERGEQELALNACVCISIPGALDEYVEYKTLTKKIKVRVTAAHVVGGFIEKYWQWMFGTVVSAIIATALAIWLTPIISSAVGAH